MHIGGVKTAFINYLFAKKHGGDFILRIEDTDSKREVAGSIDYIMRSFEWLGIKPTEGHGIGGDYGPYVQSHRTDIYKKHVDMLVESGHAYYAFDTAEELDAMRDAYKKMGKSFMYNYVTCSSMRNSLYMPKDDVDSLLASGAPYVVRFRMPRNEDVRFKDEIRGWIVFNTSNLDDKVIWKSSDGLPTYHLANVVDDHLMEISHVIRGEEWVSSTPLHVLLYEAFGWKYPIFAHLPLILGPDSKKLGKRNKYGIPVFALDWSYTDIEGEEIHINGFREAGYEPDALMNFLVLLGWNPGNDIEFMTVDEMADMFTLDRVNQAGAMFDKKKLDSFNGHYLRTRDKDWIIRHLNMPMDFMLKMDDKKVDLIAKMATERAHFHYDLSGAMSYLYESPEIEDDVEFKNVDEFVKVMNVFSDELLECDDKEWTPEHIRMELESISTNVDVKLGKVMPMLRLALTGGVPGPQLPDIMYIIGHDESKTRINHILDKIKEIA